MIDTEEAALNGAIHMIFSRRQREFSRTADATAQFDGVYRRYINPVYAFVAYRISDRDTAEDLTSRIFEKAWRGFARFDPDRASLSTWLFAIARNCLADYFRRSGKALREIELTEDIGTDAGMDAAQNPGSQLHSVGLRLDLRRALCGLDQRELDIVVLKFGGSLNNREIAGLLEISESNVGTILYRSLKKLKTQLEGDQE